MWYQAPTLAEGTAPLPAGRIRAVADALWENHDCVG